MSRRTRSTTRTSTFEAFVAEILPIIVGQDEKTSWLDAADVASIQVSCRGANEILKSATGDSGVWRTLAVKEFLNEGDDSSLLHDLVGDGGKYSSYRELYIDYPRVWLTIEASKIKSLPKWTATQHIGIGMIECGSCGCNCSNDCPGIPIESQFRFSRKERLGYYESRSVVCGLVVNHFCEPCFERLLRWNEGEAGGESGISREDYDKVEKETLYDATTNYVVNDEGRDPWKDGVGKCYYSDPFFRDWGEGGYSWQKLNKVSTDDAMIVIANALIDPDCSHKHLSIGGLHFNEKYSEKAYKALAYALSINTSLLTVTMSQSELWGESCCDWDYYFFSPLTDASNGMFLKALRLNPSHKIYRMIHCCNAFGEKVEKEIKALLKPHPVATSSKKRKH